MEKISKEELVNKIVRQEARSEIAHCVPKGSGRFAALFLTEKGGAKADLKVYGISADSIDAFFEAVWTDKLGTEDQLEMLKSKLHELLVESPDPKLTPVIYFIAAYQQAFAGVLSLLIEPPCNSVGSDLSN